MHRQHPLGIIISIIHACAMTSSFDIPTCPKNCICQPISVPKMHLYNVTCSRPTIPNDLPTRSFAVQLRDIAMAEIPANTFVHMRYLQNLTIIDSSIHGIRNTSFYGLRSLRHLTMKNCDLKQIEAAAFQPLTTIISIDIAKNRYLGLPAVGNSFYGLQHSPIESLYVSTVNTYSVFTPYLKVSFFRYLKRTRLKRIDLDSNHIAIVEAGYSKYLLHLEYFKMSHNILIGSQAAFFELFFLRNLRTLDLSYQMLMQPETTSKENHVSQYKINITLQQKKTVFIPPKLETILIGGFRNIRMNRGFTLAQPNMLTFFDRSNVRASSIPVIKGANKLEYLNLQNDDCSEMSPDFFHNYPNLRTVLVGGNQLKTYVETDVNGSFFGRNQHLKTLDISRNHIHVLPHSFLRSVKQLEILNASGNSIQEIKSFYLFKNATLINVSNNAIPTIPHPVLLVFDSFDRNLTLDISHNPFTLSSNCCDITTFIVWIRNTHVNLARSDSFLCQHKGSLVKTKFITSIFIANECHRMSPLFVTFVVVFAFCLVVSLVGTLIYRKRHTIKWWLLLFGRYARLTADGDTSEEKLYDAFVAYCVDDIRWVRKHLEPELEVKRKYKLCMHHRDFIPGYPIDENIAVSIQKSRRTILVLTKHFMKSQWCQFEVRVAARQARLERQCVIIPIILKTFDFQKADLLLKTILDDNTYISWPTTENKDMFGYCLEKSLGVALCDVVK